MFDEARRRAQAEVRAFQEARDKAGNLLHPDLDDVRREMADLVATGLDLEAAYTVARQRRLGSSKPTLH